MIDFTLLEPLDGLDDDFKVYKKHTGNVEDRNSCSYPLKYCYVIHVEPRVFQIHYSKYNVRECLDGTLTVWDEPQVYNTWIPEQIFVFHGYADKLTMYPSKWFFKSGSDWTYSYLPNISVDTLTTINDYSRNHSLFTLFCGWQPDNRTKFGVAYSDDEIQESLLSSTMLFYSSSFNCDYIKPIWESFKHKSVSKKDIGFEDYFPETSYEFVTSDFAELYNPHFQLRISEEELTDVILRR